MGLEREKVKQNMGDEIRGERKGEERKLLCPRCNWHEMLLAKISV